MENKITITLSISKEENEKIRNNIFGEENKINYQKLTIKKGNEFHRKAFGFDELVEIIIIYTVYKVIDEIWTQILDYIKKIIKTPGINRIYPNNLNKSLSNTKSYNTKDKEEMEELIKIIEEELKKRIKLSQLIIEE